jgi:predicted helicase
VLEALRAMIEQAETENPAFRAAAIRFLDHARETINPSVTAADVREMLIQHILTEEIFSHVFDNADFHRHNNVARELYRLEDPFFTGSLKHKTLEGLKPYYAAIRSPQRFMIESADWLCQRHFGKDLIRHGGSTDQTYSSMRPALRCSSFQRVVIIVPSAS